MPNNIVLPQIHVRIKEYSIGLLFYWPRFNSNPMPRLAADYWYHKTVLSSFH